MAYKTLLRPCSTEISQHIWAVIRVHSRRRSQFGKA
ncbi:hypothetical protein CCACVL1_30501 [Corchorus capsularis]|uniref:Uncharacterized protein n=1 Tax=Corchorus capsularis TaxID=210143 RepID=A0A1R3FWT8_COCAP|nr:hypothetical protein CCACVL1_30501 [Corchorus capsularis]